MSELDTDIDFTTLKVADLKRELKSRGLTTTGNKQELIERLQLSVMSNDDDNNDTDLLADANDLLGGDDDDDDDDVPIEQPKQADKPAKKVAIKRDTALPTEAPKEPAKTEAIKAPEKTKAEEKADDTEKVAAEKDAEAASPPKAIKAMTDAERAAARAARFGDVSTDSKKQARAARFGSSDSSKSSNNKIAAAPAVDLETLKKRAERFGQASSNVMKKAEMDEKIRKRQERFGLVEKESAAPKKAKKDELLEKLEINKTVTASPTPKVADEKMLKRAERFGTVAT